MIITSYNPSQMGDILVAVLGPDKGKQQISQNGDIVQIKDENGQAIGYNFLNASKLIPSLNDENGQVHLTEEELAKLNNEIKQADFAEELPASDEPKFIVGYVAEMENHPDSDHLHVTQTEVQDHKKLQLVSGSPNMKQGVKVVVAEIGAMMPSGEIIWPGELRGVESDGMICSGRELRIPGAPNKPGALLLPDSYQVGEPFNFEEAATLFNE